MLFSSPIFLFVFLPSLILLYWVAGTRLRNGLLLLASWIFYVWGDPVQLPLLWLAILVNFGLGRWIGGRVQAGKNARPILLLGLLFNLGLLGYYKYGFFLLDNVARLVALLGLTLPDGVMTGLKAYFADLALKLPMGISFFTFSAVSYLLDVSKKLHPPQMNLWRFAVYISLFPKLIAGPIARYREIDRQYEDRAFKLAGLAEGLRRFAFGLAKKVLLAAPLGRIVDGIFENSAGELAMGTAWLGAVAFALQIYYDFSGYTDMAIGLGQMFGYRLPENFNAPYLAVSIADFWRRWHITLSNWFRDYVYFPLERKRNRAATILIYTNILIVFLLTGLWHGAAWTYIIWGALQGVLIAIERTRFGDWLNAAPRPVKHLYAIPAILVSWVIFRSPGMRYALAYLLAMIGYNGQSGVIYPTMFLNGELWLALILGLVFILPFFTTVTQRAGAWKAGEWRHTAWDMMINGLALVLLVVSAAYLAGQTVQAFIYFRF